MEKLIKHRIVLNVIMTCLLIFLSTCFFEDKTPEDQNIWKYTEPYEVGMDTQSMLVLDDLIQASIFGVIHSLIIIKDDHLVFENYYTDKNRTTQQDISGISFAIASAALGLAIEDGLINSLDDEIRDYLPEYSEFFEPLRRSQGAQIGLVPRIPI